MPKWRHNLAPRVSLSRKPSSPPYRQNTPEYASKVRDIILHPPESRPYDRFREQLVKRTGTSAQRRLQQLLTTEELGDRKPSQLLRRMQLLLGDRAADTDDALVRELFLQRLPANVRVVLASAPDTTSLDDLAQLADCVVDAAPPTIAAVTAPPQQEVEQLRAEVSRLAELITSRSPARHRSPTPHRSLSPGNQSLCWYHERFGSDACKCRPPCSMSGNEGACH